RRGQTSSFGYNSLNQLVSETYPDSTVARSYDANSRLVQVNDSASGAFTFSYDATGRLIDSATPMGEVQYAYDNASRVKSRQVVGQPAVGSSYDLAGNLLNASMPQASVTRTYDQRNLVKSSARPNGVNSAYGYDPLGRIQSLTHSSSGGVLNTQSYSYDAV